MVAALVPARIVVGSNIKEHEIMRTLICVGTLAMLSACAATPTVGPRQYLDEQTAATITAVPEPWIFHREGTTPQLDFVHLYAVDVNRMGEHRQYLVVVKHWPAPDFASEPIPALEVSAESQQVHIEAVQASARELGVGQALDKTAPKGAQSWFYPVDQSVLRVLSRSPDVKLGLTHSEGQASYIVWRDGHAAFRELSETVANTQSSQGKRENAN